MFRQNDFAALSAPPQLLKRRVDPAWDEGLKWFKCTMGGGISLWRRLHAYTWYGWLMVDSDWLGITWNRQRMAERMYEFCWVLPFSTDFIVETGNSPWPPRERMVRASISEQPGQSTKWSTFHASKRSSNTAAPLFAQVSSLHTLRPSSILSKVRLRASNKTSHETRERSELGVGSQTLLTLPNFISLAPLYFHTHKTFCAPHLPSDIQRCHGIPNSW